MLDASDTPRPDDAPDPIGEPPNPPVPPEGDPLPEPGTPPVKGGRSDNFAKTGDGGDKLGDFA